jgi:predicted TIM-barrel fold metal-dependent hydrolase
MTRDITRRDFWKAAGFGGALIAARPYRLSAHHEQHTLPPGITREDLVNLVDGPWLRLRAVLEKKVIDFHTHNIQLEDTALNWSERAAIRSSGQASKQGEVDYTDAHILDMEIHGIERAVVQPPMMAPWVSIEKWLQTIGRHPAKLLEVATARGLKPNDAIQFIRSRVADGGARIVTGPGGGRTVDEERPLLELAEQLDVPVFCNMPTDGNYGLRRPDKLIPFIREFPKVKFALEDAAGKSFMTPAGHIGVQMAGSFDNVYWMTDGAPVEFIESLVKTVGAERILFGSDLSYPHIRYYLPLGHRTAYLRWRNLNAVALADITEDQRDFILHKNARRLLKLTENPTPAEPKPRGSGG